MSVSSFSTLSIKNKGGDDANSQTNKNYGNRKKDNFMYNHIGQFLLKLHENGCLRNKGFIKKQFVRDEFRKYCKNSKELTKYLNNDLIIGNLLYDNGFLINTEKNSGLFQIKLRSFQEFYNDELKKMDDKHIQMSALKILPKSVKIIQEESENQVIVVNDDEVKLEFQKGNFMENVRKDFYMTDMSCFLCQQNFCDQETFENHVEYHGEASGFQSIINYKQETNSDLELSYSTCNNSYLLRFKIKSNLKNLSIEKIIIIRSRCMDYARNEDVPFLMPLSGIDYFYVDCHLLSIDVPQPVCIVYRRQNDNMLNIAQFLFMRFDEFPVINMKLKSCQVISRSELKMKSKLPFYFPEGKILELCRKDNFSNDVLGMINVDFRNYLKDDKKLTHSNICEIFKILLQIEDVKIDSKYKGLSQKAVEIQGYCGEYSVKMKNLSAYTNISNILKQFDEVRLTPCNNRVDNARGCNKERNSGSKVENNNEYKNNKRNDQNKRKQHIFCNVCRIYNSVVCFSPREKEKTISLNQKYDIQFSTSRIPIIYQYRALEILKEKPYVRKFLFPTVNSNKTSSSLSLNYFYKSIEFNPEQKQAIQNITEGVSCAAPYIIFGPPGTGKTTTIVESIYQLWKKNNNYKVLVTAGSNAACDEVSRRLCEVFEVVNPNGLNLLRIYAASNESRIDNINESLLEASNLCHNYHFYPSIESITSYSVIVATLTVVGRLVQGKLSENHFTHIFIDECAASTEPEALVGIAGVLSPSSYLILSGDPNQLGPILESPKAAELGLSISLMERLLKYDCYKIENGKYDKTIQTRLIRNFRSNPKILELSNRLYYNMELVYCANKEIADFALGWTELPVGNFPIIFNNVVLGGSEKRGTSYLNYEELKVTMDYIMRLMYFGINGKKINEDDIGVISPYKEQCNLIREELDKRRWYKIEVGSVETFQGKEKLIIIISMVRSDRVGFLDNPRRLNVTLTRAKALMIIIGRAKTLSDVEDWNYVINYCDENNGLIGAQYPVIGRKLGDCKTTSYSTLSTISNTQKENKRNNNNSRHHRYRHCKAKNVDQKCDIRDDESISSSVLINEVNNWLENTKQYRNENCKNDDDFYNISDDYKSSMPSLNTDKDEYLDKISKINLNTEVAAKNSLTIHKNFETNQDRIEFLNKTTKINVETKITSKNLANDIKCSSSTSPNLNKDLEEHFSRIPESRTNIVKDRTCIPERRLHSDKDIYPMTSVSKLKTLNNEDEILNKNNYSPHSGLSDTKSLINNNKNNTNNILSNKSVSQLPAHVPTIGFSSSSSTLSVDHSSPVISSTSVHRQKVGVNINDSKTRSTELEQKDSVCIIS